MQPKFCRWLHVHGTLNSNDWNNVFDAWVHSNSVSGGITAPPEIPANPANWTNHYCSCPPWEIQNYKSIIPQLCHCSSPVTGLEINCRKLAK